MVLNVERERNQSFPIFLSLLGSFAPEPPITMNHKNPRTSQKHTQTGKILSSISPFFLRGAFCRLWHGFSGHHHHYDGHWFFFVRWWEHRWGGHLISNHFLWEKTASLPCGQFRPPIIIMIGSSMIMIKCQINSEKMILSWESERCPKDLSLESGLRSRRAQVSMIIETWLLCGWVEFVSLCGKMMMMIGFQREALPSWPPQ